MSAESRTRREPTARNAVGSRRLLTLLSGVSAQGSQALALMVLQVLTARLLGASGLGIFATLYAFVILATAVISGFVGDSLTVLDRSRPAVRAALQIYWLALSGVLGFVLGGGAAIAGVVDGYTSIALAAATSAFVLQDSVRRLLMACLAFWRVVAVDIAGLVFSVGWIGAAWKFREGGVSLAVIFTALAVGQGASLLVGISLLPKGERWLASWRGAAYREVFNYGSWRAMQQVIRPTMTALVRIACVTIVSAAAAGELEAARIYMAPAMIIIGGVNSVLFARYAIDRSRPLRTLVRGVDRSVVVLLAAVSALCAIALWTKPIVGPLLTGGEYELSAVALMGWAAFAAATAASTPYGQLLAVRGHHVGVFIIRLADSAIAVVLTVVVLQAGVEVSWVPAVLAALSLVGGVAMRWLLHLRARGRSVGQRLETPPEQ